MDSSVIICTYKRAESLRQTLQTCCELVIPDGATWELLVVDNNSCDHTRQVCDAFTDDLPLRYVFESTQGKSAALNRSIQESRGGLLLFTDDDVDVDSGWLWAHADAAQRYANASFFGGKVLARWDAAPPKWVLENLGWLHTNVHVDRGDQEAPMTELVEGEERAFFVGANIAIRRAVFSSALRFKEAIGPVAGDDRPSGYMPGEDVELEGRLLEAGHVGVYIPKAIVYHRHSAHRQTERYVRRYYFGAGITSVRLLKERRSSPYWLGAPRSCWKSLFLSSLTYGLTRLWAPSRTWLRAEKGMACAWGNIYEWRRRAGRRNAALALQEHGNGDT